MLDVNFSFFDPQPQDYHSIKLLLSQLLGHVDAATGDLDLAGVTDLVLEQKLVGSTVKTDSGEDDDKANEGDPYAVLTVLNLNVHKVSLYPVLLERGDFAFSLSLARCGFCIHTEISLPPHQDKPAISSLIKYLLSKLDSPASSAFHAQLSALLQNPVGEEAEAKKQQQHVGLVLSERMVNMPTQIVPPMYRMLQEELQWAVEDVSVPVNPAQNSPVTAVFLKTARFADFAVSSVVHPHRKSPTTFRTSCSSRACFSHRPPRSRTTRTRRSNRPSSPRPGCDRRRSRRRRRKSSARAPPRMSGTTRRSGCTTRRTSLSKRCAFSAAEESCLAACFSVDD